jgi:Peptidase family M28
VMDMIAHNRASAPYLFQVSPGEGTAALALAREAVRATEAWNSHVDAWNRAPERAGRGRAVRSADPSKVPEIAAHPTLRPEVRQPLDARSSLFNTDGQIFSDVGVPVILFMEDYDISRAGYHDTEDTVANIDLDYGAAVAAVAIETVARLAAQP